MKFPHFYFTVTAFLLAVFGPVIAQPKDVDHVLTIAVIFALLACAWREAQ